MLDNLTFFKQTSWQDVFIAWKSQEGSDPVWQRFAKEEKGWESWDAWRSHQARLINAAYREWSICEIPDPNSIVPQFLMGPYRGWQKQYAEEEANTHTFADLVRDNIQWVKENIGVKTRTENFPQSTQMIGVYAEDEGKIILYEGHHRATAIAFRVHEGDPIVFAENPTIAVVKMNGEDLSKFREMLYTSTHKKDLKLQSHKVG
ncbi:MAG: hypothetical protein COV60_00285 [Candidatus Magasanikbacteria bacterium CG11_big_fil_rev_8_21_14_0_20_43_7]|uniref:Uncharacterized protein n=1 Tax=Candidatus Magasanikbacteria bacterium CG11_big_fil_rev_8_21_14_0_20_43_7 TaxID=1974654 RepID=A0A2H0N5P7_9BACT|nr:MAG: hypothetical protein COV60_00285 [Candidatus Magasanikbacteria bacterium CG11_big_fil_rev_8_21_14_0_20_43_7]